MHALTQPWKRRSCASHGSFLRGHDSNFQGLLNALGVGDKPLGQGLSAIIKRYGLIQLIQYQLYQILVYHTKLKEDERGESCTVGI